MAENKVDFYNFSNMHYDLSKVSASQTVLEVYPEMAHYPAYTDAADMEVRLALHLCDPKGPFAAIKQYNVRLLNVCKWLQIPIEAPGNELYEAALNLSSENILNIWTTFLSQVFNHEYTAWFSNSLMYYQMMEQMRKPIDFSSKTDWANRQAIEARADTVYNRMKKMEEIVLVDETIKRKSFSKSKDLIENYAEKFAVPTSVI